MKKPNKLNELYSSLETISIDYGIMERSSNGLMVPANFLWSDLGSWTALDEMIKKDDAGNICEGKYDRYWKRKLDHICWGKTYCHDRSERHGGG